MRVGCDLLIPGQYVIQDEIFLEPFWKEFALTWGYWKSVLTTLLEWFRWVSFLILGLGEDSRSEGSLGHGILSAIVSLTIEVLHAQLPTRKSGTTDILINTFGTWLGVVG